MDEIELKFEIPAHRKAAVQAAMKRAALTSQHLRAQYFDTADELLARHRFALRLRQENDRWVQTLKGATADSMRRLEHNVEVVPAPGMKAPAIDLALHDGTPAGDALKELLADKITGKGRAKGKGPGDDAASSTGLALEARYATDVRRASRVVRSGSSRIELAYDLGAVVAGGVSLPICELEFELKSGNAGDLVALAQRWVTQHGLWLDMASKAERGTRLARGERVPPAARAQPLVLDTGASAEQALRAIVGNCLAQITANAGPVAAGSGDADHVHQLRVGIRRLRTALRAWGSATRDGAAGEPAWEPTLRQVFRALGEYRDRQSVIEHMEPQLAAVGAPDRRATASAKVASKPAPPALPNPSETVLSPDFQSTLLQLLAFCSTDAATPADVNDTGKHPGQGRDEPPLKATALLKRRLDKLDRQVTHDAKRFQSLSETDQHRVRKRLKRLRYLAEFARTLFDRKKVDRYLDALKPAQDALGTHNDEIVALQAYAQAAASDPHAAFAAGWLTARKPDNVRQCRASLEQIAHAGRFWKRRG